MKKKNLILELKPVVLKKDRIVSLSRQAAITGGASVGQSGCETNCQATIDPQRCMSFNCPTLCNPSCKTANVRECILHSYGNLCDPQ